MDYREVKEKLLELSEGKYKDFISTLTPGAENILGIRIPLLRKLAKEIAKGDFRKFLKEVTDDTFEEVMLQGMVIGLCNADIEEILAMAADYIPKINNWAVCDNFCSELKITNKHRERVLEFLQPYLYSDKEFEIRFGVVMLLDYYIQPEYAPMAFAHFDRIKHEGYYVKMGVAWAISKYFIYLPEITMEYLKDNMLDKFTYHKSLQKIIESFRVGDAMKEIIRGMRRK